MEVEVLLLKSPWPVVQRRRNESLFTATSLCLPLGNLYLYGHFNVDISRQSLQYSSWAVYGPSSTAVIWDATTLSSLSHNVSASCPGVLGVWVSDPLCWLLLQPQQPWQPLPPRSWLPSPLQHLLSCKAEGSGIRVLSCHWSPRVADVASVPLALFCSL